MSKLYILVRNDLFSMNCGKAMAQASHASSQFVTKYPKESKKWCNEADGFGTTIVMEGTKEQINKVMNTTEMKSLPHGDIIDPTYPFKLQLEVSKIAVFYDNYNVVIDDEPVDRYGFVPATRTEHTCSWFYMDDSVAEHIRLSVEEDMEFNKICLHR